MDEKECVVLDFSECEYIGSLHKVIKDGLSLPKWYGSNLDALWDALTGLIITPIVIEIVYCPNTVASKKMKPYVDNIIHVFNEAEKTTNGMELRIDCK